MTTLFPSDTLLAYLAAVLIVVLAPGPDNILAISRGAGATFVAASLSILALDSRR
jgi:threonine/homoserine/homoserine lactone efflux protein